jgi:hypothetical protein
MYPSTVHAQANGGAASTTPAVPSASRADSGFVIRGNVQARAIFYQSSPASLSPVRVPFSYVLSGAVVPSVGDFSVPVTFTLTEQERPWSQPLNTFSIAPTYKWITARGGFINPNYNPFTIAGHQMLGAGLELTPGNFRLGVSYGQLLRAIPDSTSAPFVVIPAYSRTGLAARLGYGDQANFFELSFLRATDDSTSLSTRPTRLQVGDITPAQNIVVGASTRLSFGTAVSIYANAAASGFTRDMGARTLNEGASNPIPTFARDLLRTNISTQLYTAIDGGVNILLQNFSALLSYTRVDPDYRSMGVYFVNNDLQLISGSVNAAFADQAVRVSASVGIQNDNLQNKKLATTQRIIPNVVVSLNPSQSFGIDLAYSDMFVSQTAGRAPLNDTARVAMTMPTFSVLPRVTLLGTTLMHSITGNATYQRLVDGNSFTRGFSEFTSLNATLGYSLTFLADALTVGVTGNVANLDGAFADYTSSGGSLSVSKNFGGLTLSATGAYSVQPSYNVLNAIVQASYRTGIHTFGLNGFFTSGSNSTGNLFNELTGVVSYAITF